MATNPTDRGFSTNFLDAACRQDFVTFIDRVFHWLSPGAPFYVYCYILSLAYHLELVRTGRLERLIINLPPRMGKSIVGSIAFPAFVLGHDPTKRIIAASYSSDLAVKLANDFREVIAAPWYQRTFPEMRVSPTKNTEFEVATTHRGYRLASSLDGSLTGRGGDFIIIDDPLKPNDAASDTKRERANSLYFSNVFPRLDNKRHGAIVLLMQRLHIDDLTSALLRRSDEWKVLSFPAIAESDEIIQIGENRFHKRLRGDVLDPEREPRSVLDSIKRQDLGLEAFAAQYQQSPIPPGGAMIKTSWIPRYDRLPTRTSTSTFFQSWDTASKPGDQNSFSVCTTFMLQDNKYYLAHILRDRFDDYPTLRDRAIEHARRCNAKPILIEDTGLGTGLIAEAGKAGLAVIPVKPVRDKGTRMALQTPKIRAGLFLLPNQASWLDDLLLELSSFPGSRYTDQVDSISQALAYEIPAFGWSDRANEGYARLAESLAFNSFFGAVTGRPW
jgi:predicted phage terminase large subunit-like protein